MKDLLEVLRVQRHNFVNHLQVISGLLQLKKYDRIMEYVREIGEEYNQASLVARLEVPEITGLILVSELAAAKQGIALNRKITTTLDRGLKDPAGTAALVKEMLEIATAMADAGPHKTVELVIGEETNYYVFEVSFQSPAACSTEPFRILAESAKGAADTGHSLEIAASKEGAVITLKVIPVDAGNIDIL